MGNDNSTSSNKEVNRPEKSNENDNSNEFDSPDEKELRAIRYNLKHDQEAFLLNNLMLCIQFFENYEREILEIRSKLISQREDDLNKILSNTQKHVLLPDVLQEQSSTHVKFKSTKSFDCQSTIETIKPVRMYVVLDNVNVDDDGTDNSASSDTTVYKMCLDPSYNNGFVRIRSLDATTRKTDHTRSMTSLHNPDRTMYKESYEINSQSNLSHLNNNHYDEGYEESFYSRVSDRRSSGSLQHVKHAKHRQSVESIPRSSRSSGYKSGSSGTNYVIENDFDYEYGTTSASSRTSVMSSLSRVDLPDSSSEIPDSCFKKYICTRDGKIQSDKPKRVGRSQNPLDRRIIRAERCANEERLYLRKDRFRRYFEKLFVNRLAQRLGFDIQDDADVSRRGAVIQCYSIDLRKNDPALITPYEIVPSVRAKWPKCCSEWLQRSRGEVKNLKNGENWLTEKMIDDVERLGCHIIPESYAAKRNSDPYRDIEWQITFPRAESYLETTLSDSQAKVYLTTLMLHKYFMNSSAATNQGLTTSHIRSELFLLLEKNFSPLIWSDNRAGESLRGFLIKLHNRVSQSEPILEDYLMRRRNMFDNVPRQSIHASHKQLKRIIDNPVMYLIASMKNIEYKKKFFPVIDCGKLFELLTLDHRKLVALVNPALKRVDRPVRKGDEKEMRELSDDFDGVGRRIITTENNGNSINQMKVSRNELVVEITEECAELRGLRLSLILDMLIKHFIKMAESCYVYGSTKMKDVYLNQAYWLSIILSDQSCGKEDSENYFGTIDDLRHKFSDVYQQGNEPENLSRESHAAISVPLNEYFTDEKSRGFDVRYACVSDRIINDIETDTETSL